MQPKPVSSRRHATDRHRAQPAWLPACLPACLPVCLPAASELQHSRLTSYPTSNAALAQAAFPFAAQPAPPLTQGEEWRAPSAPLQTALLSLPLRTAEADSGNAPLGSCCPHPHPMLLQPPSL